MFEPGKMALCDVSYSCFDAEKLFEDQLMLIHDSSSSASRPSAELIVSVRTRR